MRRLFRQAVVLLKWLIIAGVLVEVCSLMAVTLSNYWIYGQLRDGEPVRYDPYAVFITKGWPRPTANNPAPPDRRHCRTIWLFGGSTMSGATDDNERTIPSFLAKILNREEPVSPACLVNFGEPSFNSLMETKYLQKALIENRPRPDVIIFYDGANDCAYFAQDRTPYAHYGYRRLQGLVESYYRSFFGLFKPLNAAWYACFTRELAGKIRQGLVPIEQNSPLIRQFVDRAEERYDYVNELAERFGAKFLLFWQPCWWVETEPVSAQVRAKEGIIMDKRSALHHNFLVPYRALADRLRTKPYFVDFQNILCSRTEPFYQQDGIHLQDPGREMVARRMGQVLKERLLRTAASGAAHGESDWGPQ